ncbi:acyltransferase family protein [Butyrivibrio fibrisolvens]|uniref:acyltransferase family protein n=1 Tax=Butyrivibrio fibrisolvens TaxID=831 RepID=UPI00041CC1C9|nr:acyltransferase family protein [Butyrivibrio fibrisolvens]
MKQRNRNIDVLRGMGIILVVIGHSLQATFEEHNSMIAFKAIYSFHMPLLMFVSGLAVAYTTSLDFSWIIKKIKSLLVPFLAWLVIPCLFTHDWTGYWEYLMSVFLYPDNALWFLWSLFLNHCVFYVFWHLGRKNCLAFNIFLLVVLSPLTVIKAPLRINMMPWYYAFYIIGYLTVKYQIKHHISKFFFPVLILSFGLWSLFLPLWNRDKLSYLSLWILKNFNIKSDIILFLIDKGLLLIISISGVIWFSLISTRICRLKISMLLEIIGTNSLEIYVLQGFFFNVFTLNNPYFRLVINTATGLLIPLAISITSHNGKINKLLFGR